jgi:selenocysteine lyase/cysteine desulfurase
MLQRIDSCGALTLWGPATTEHRVPTFAVTHACLTPAELATTLGDEGVFVWDGDFYAVEPMRVLGLEPGGVVRIGLLHYNTLEEVERLFEVIDSL